MTNMRKITGMAFIFHSKRVGAIADRAKAMKIVTHYPPLFCTLAKINKGTWAIRKFIGILMTFVHTPFGTGIGLGEAPEAAE